MHAILSAWVPSTLVTTTTTTTTSRRAAVAPRRQWRSVSLIIWKGNVRLSSPRRLLRWARYRRSETDRCSRHHPHQRRGVAAPPLSCPHPPTLQPFPTQRFRRPPPSPQRNRCQRHRRVRRSPTLPPFLLSFPSCPSEEGGHRISFQQQSGVPPAVLSSSAVGPAVALGALLVVVHPLAAAAARPAKTSGVPSDFGYGSSLRISGIMPPRGDPPRVFRCTCRLADTAAGAWP